ncbi:D-alanyl-D-alanine carboxypeptidase [Streptococcus sp. DD10]|uniref:D-alanyl-D-alanine carboxypeptidase PBP3 n=1 Tax=Streptococcus sp. DD10 TaxID=1777878 RepID=UPI00079C6555|nr:D-alanyl-D-alanine carboxypeptidase PBP3 [Streptococcus sp. DD10]KXT72492.1 D-alanyl-D-alanine carboxypeptidase [Streptococcus sp. DD10]
MKQIIFIISCLICLIGGKVGADDFSVSANQAIAIDADSGKILYEKEADQQVSIASITTLLSTYLVYEAIDKGDLKMTDAVTISDYPYNLSVTAQVSNVPLDARNYTVQQLLEASLIASANSATIALAEKVAGSEEAFVNRMRDKLKEWGINDAFIINSTGLNNSILGEQIYPGSKEDDENTMSARQVAILARRLVKDFPQVLDITQKPYSDFAGTQLQTFNYMLKGQPRVRSGVTGLKTGTSEKGGASFVATATENGMNIISVVLGAEGADEDIYARFIVTTRLLDYISQNFTPTTLIAKGESYRNSRALVTNGKSQYVDAIAKEDLIIIQRFGADTNVPVTIKTDNKGYEAPFKKGIPVGTASYEDNDLIGQGYLQDENKTITLISKNKVERSNFLKVMWNEFVRYVNEKL